MGTQRICPLKQRATYLWMSRYNHPPPQPNKAIGRVHAAVSMAAQLGIHFEPWPYTPAKALKHWPNPGSIKQRVTGVKWQWPLLVTQRTMAQPTAGTFTTSPHRPCGEGNGGRQITNQQGYLTSSSLFSNIRYSGIYVDSRIKEIFFLLYSCSGVLSVFHKEHKQ